MYKFHAKHLFVCALSSAVPVFAGTAPIGVAVSQGNIVVDSLKAPGSATIFDGNVLQTGDSPSQVRLKDGAQVRFGADSRGKLFSDHLELEQGSASVSGIAARANGMSVRTDANGSATVALQNGVVEVSAVTGNAHVFNAQGVNVANLAPGKALSLRAQEAGKTTASSLVGCAVKEGNDLLLTDETSNVTVRLGGDAVKTGRRVQLTGELMPSKSGSTDLTGEIKVASVKELGGPCQPAMVASMHTGNSVNASGMAAPMATSNGATAASGTAAVAAATAATVATGTSSAAVGVGSTAVIAGIASAAAAPTVSTVSAASGTTGSTGTTISGRPVCISPCTF